MEISVASIFTSHPLSGFKWLKTIMAREYGSSPDDDAAHQMRSFLFPSLVLLETREGKSEVFRKSKCFFSLKKSVLFVEMLSTR